MRLRDQMPEFESTTDWLNSHPIQKNDLVGDKPTLIHFWSVSCDLCTRAMPKINQIRDTYHPHLNVIAVHMPRSDEDQDINRVQEVASAHDISQPIYLDQDHILTDIYKNRYVPAYYVFDEMGILRHFQAGAGGMIMLEKRIKRVLN